MRLIKWLDRNAPGDMDLALVGLTTVFCAGGLVALLTYGG